MIENGSFESAQTLTTTASWGWYKQDSGTIEAAGTPLFGTNALSLSGTGNQRVLQQFDIAQGTELRVGGSQHTTRPIAQHL